MTPPLRKLQITALMIAGYLALPGMHAADSFQPPKAYLDISYPEYGGGPIQLYSAKEFSSILPLLENDQCRIIWVLSQPPTTATKTMVAGLFILAQKNGKWVISDSRRFEAAGKYSDAKATVTSEGATYPRITVTLHQGGRGAAWEETSSYRVKDGKIILDLPVEKGRRKDASRRRVSPAVAYQLFGPLRANTGPILLCDLNKLIMWPCDVPRRR